jgi:hypothetical protein
MEHSLTFRSISEEEWSALVEKISALEEAIQLLLEKDSPSEYLSEEQALELLDISSRQLSRYRKQQLITFYQYGKTIRYRRCDIERFVESFKISSRYEQ